jgi:hypothetical protein
MAKVIVLQNAVCKAGHHKRHGKKENLKKAPPLSSGQNYNYT